MNWFKKKKVVAPPQPRPMFPHRFGFSLEYWRTRQDLMEWAAKLYRTPQFHEFISVLRHELPIDSTVEAVRAHVRLLRIIELMAVPLPAPSDDVPITYGAEKEFPDLSSDPEQTT